jgi:hypothetical protein
MEIVCSILKGINVILRELNIDNNVQSSLVMRDFREKKIIQLTSIQVLKREYFENIA